MYHLFFTIIQAEFITSCLQSNANTKGIRASGFHGIMTNLKLKASYLVLFFFFFFYFLLPGLLKCEQQRHVFSSSAVPSWTASQCLGSDTCCSSLALTCKDASQLRAMALLVTKPLCFGSRADVPTPSLKSKECASHMISLLFPPLHRLWGWAQSRVCLRASGAPHWRPRSWLSSCVLL